VLLHPHKKSQKKLLTNEQKLENKTFASERIKVEQSISGLKRYRILSERLRTQSLDFYDKILGVCAGLWNFYFASISL
jgi:DDE superfamily endonuclease